MHQVVILPRCRKRDHLENFLELEEFLELKDGEQLEDLYSRMEVTMEDFLMLEEWLEGMERNSKKNFDDDQHTSRGDRETSPKASIDRHQPNEIDRHPPYIVARHATYRIDLCPPDYINRHTLLDELQSCVVELEPTEERMHKSESSHLSVLKHQRPLIWAEEVARIHKRVKRINDPVKFVVSCAMVEVEFPILPDRSVNLGFYNRAFDDHMFAVASQRGLRFRGEIIKGSTEEA